MKHTDISHVPSGELPSFHSDGDDGLVIVDPRHVLARGVAGTWVPSQYDPNVRLNLATRGSMTMERLLKVVSKIRKLRYDRQHA